MRQHPPPLHQRHQRANIHAREARTSTEIGLRRAASGTRQLTHPPPEAEGSVILQAAKRL
ncbi:hypothetical protein BC830DRAFT_1103560, partial [Chytriomyces sp. MP71]